MEGIGYPVSRCDESLLRPSGGSTLIRSERTRIPVNVH
jgi:hypothetical protein